MSFIQTLREMPGKEIAARVLFYTTFLHLAFLIPNIRLIPSERARVFSGLLCALTLGAAWLGRPDGHQPGTRNEVLVSLILSILVILSGMFSLTPASSSYRGFVVLASGLGGFWCARILLFTPFARRFCLFFSLVTLAGILAMGLLSYGLKGFVYQALDANQHPVAARIMLLWWAPLALLLDSGVSWAGPLGAWLLLVASYAVLYLNSLRFTLAIPFILALEAALFKAWRWRYVLALAVPVLAATAYLATHVPQFRTGPGSESFYYRVESYRFSLVIASKHPWLGIGLRAPRDEFLEGYEIKYPFVSREQFTESVKRIRTSENIFLTFIAEVGLPFTFLYVAALVVLLTRLVRRVRARDPGAAIPPLALLLALTAGLLHFQTLDGLLHPQVSWFFHLLLGLSAPESSGQSTLSGTRIQETSKA